MMERLRQVPPWAWIAVVAAAGLGFLTYHRFAQDDADTSWTDVDQAPVRAPYPDVPGHDHICAPMETCTGFRSRAYPGSLVHADFSIIGEVGVGA